MATNPIKYTSRTFTTILEDINNDEELRPKPNWFKRLWAGIGDVFSMWVNVASNLAFLRTAFTRQSVADHLALIDYYIAGATTSSGTLIFDVKRDAIFPLTFTTANLVASTTGSGVTSSVRFESRTPYTFSATIETFTADAGTDLLTVTQIYTTGMIVRLTTTDTLPTPLAIDTDYYVVYVSDTTIKLATTRNNAYNNVTIDITSIGVGIHSIQLFSFVTTVYQQESISVSKVIGTSDGTTSWQEFELPDAFVIDSTLVITIGLDTWTAVETLVDSSPTDTHYRIIPLSDNKKKILFGDGTYGAIPANFDIFAFYAYGGGINSNISNIDQINQYSGSNTNISGVSNPLALSGGANDQSLEEAKRLGPLLLRARNRFVTSQDGKALAEAFEGVSLAKINKNVYGVLSAQVPIIPDGGGLPSTALKTSLQTYLIDRTALESMDIRVVDPDFNIINPNMSVKVVTGALFVDVDPYVQLALTLLFTETSNQIIALYDTEGLSATIEFINSKYGFSFASADSQANILISNIPLNDFGKTFQRSDIEGYVDVYVNDVDYVIYNSTVPIINDIDQITQPGTITTVEIV